MTDEKRWKGTEGPRKQEGEKKKRGGLTRGGEVQKSRGRGK